MLFQPFLDDPSPAGRASQAAPGRSVGDRGLPAVQRMGYGWRMGKRSSGFIDTHDLLTDTQREQARELAARLEREPLQFVRMAWADPHGASRAKAVTLPVFLAALSEGYNINVATTTLDSANARTFNSFTRGGGMGLDEMTGSPNLVIVPDPSTFRILPWAPGVGWVLCDEYFKTGVPFHFSPRHLLRKQLRRLEDHGMRYVLGLEIEWYLLRVAENSLGEARKPICRCARSRTSGARARSNAPLRPPRRCAPPTTRCSFAPRPSKSVGGLAISRPSCAARASRVITPAAGTCTNR